MITRNLLERIIEWCKIYDAAILAYKLRPQDLNLTPHWVLSNLSKEAFMALFYKNASLPR